MHLNKVRWKVREERIGRVPLVEAHDTAQRRPEYRESTILSVLENGSASMGNWLSESDHSLTPGRLGAFQFAGEILQPQATS